MSNFWFIFSITKTLTDIIKSNLLQIDILINNVGEKPIKLKLTEDKLDVIFIW